MDYSKHHKHNKHQEFIPKAPIKDAEENEEVVSAITEEDTVDYISKTPVHEKPVKTIEKTKQIKVTVNKLNVRSVPEIPSPVITMVSKNDILTTADSLDRKWIAVKTIDGLTGFVLSEFVK